MKEKNHKEIFFNRANVKKAERIVCDDCFEHIVFHLKDQNNNSFSLGLKTVFECIVFAIENGDLPKLPLSWLGSIDNVYRTDLSERENIFYFDE